MLTMQNICNESNYVSIFANVIIVRLDVDDALKKNSYR